MYVNNRRRSERIQVKDFIRVFCLEDKTLHAMELVDSSREGCALRMKYVPGILSSDQIQVIRVRFYFSSDTYLQLDFDVKNSRPLLEDGVRYVILGCAIDRRNPAYESYEKFVDFLKMYSESAQRDLGDNEVAYL